MTVTQKNCRVVTDGNETFEGGTPLDFIIPCGNTYTAYASLFQSTRVTGTIFIFVNTASTCTFTATIDSAGQQPIIVVISPTDTNRTISLTVDCLQRIVFSCIGGASGACLGNFSLQLHWCKCC